MKEKNDHIYFSRKERRATAVHRVMAINPLNVDPGLSHQPLPRKLPMYEALNQVVGLAELHDELAETAELYPQSTHPAYQLEGERRAAQRDMVNAMRAQLEQIIFDKLADEPSLPPPGA